MYVCIYRGAAVDGKLLSSIDDSQCIRREKTNSESVSLFFSHSFIHSGHFCSVPSSPLLLRGVPDYSTDTVSEFHAEAHRQLQVKYLPKVPAWRLERESNPRPSG